MIREGKAMSKTCAHDWKFTRAAGFFECKKCGGIIATRDPAFATLYEAELAERAEKEAAAAKVRGEEKAAAVKMRADERVAKREAARQG